MSDQEWEIRTGRAIYVLQQTLPEFFDKGLVASVDTAPSILNNHDSTMKDMRKESQDVEIIYSPRIRLSYTPPEPLPSPFPQTLHVDGLPLYMASSAFVRHTLKALYTDLYIELRKITVQSSSSRSSTARQEPGSPPNLPDSEEGKIHGREKSLSIRTIVSGSSRVSGARGEWDIESTYFFSPVSGLINLHAINSIHPAPHLSAYDAIRVALAKLGFGPSTPKPGGATPGAACQGPPKVTSSSVA
ncbi:hypothetical protein JAAARDRAFT_195818 [Jaapia argillacea MUCL 33604]|uniref:Uncharacterized protein n=1 Tax=Jaapia argillacea MUCL 33604 TaxID=933084 RepID=A0A067PNQ4_9AGAM|nr:hypothetical protein JAAARDRAFT_195818 [Jaapia argillacea MUCL 33604]